MRSELYHSFRIYLITSRFFIYNIPRSSHKNKNRRPARAFFRTIRLRTLNRNGT